MKSLLTLALAALLISGCGALFIPSTKTVSVNSVPVEARVTIDGVDYGLTPLAVELDNNESHTIVVSKDGYETVSCVLNAKVKGGIVVLDVLGGLLPVVIDAATGAWKSLDTTVCSVRLPERQ